MVVRPIAPVGPGSGRSVRRHLLALGVALLAGCARARLPAPPPAAISAPIGSASADFFRTQPRDPAVRHVHMMHLDGMHADIFRAMLEADMLPHFKLLLVRGKISYTAATVDKSETFKVIQSYLTSRVDTEITGWWLFDRQQLQF